MSACPGPLRACTCYAFSWRCSADADYIVFAGACHSERSLTFADALALAPPEAHVDHAHLEAAEAELRAASEAVLPCKPTHPPSAGPPRRATPRRAFLGQAQLPARVYVLSLGRLDVFFCAVRAWMVHQR